MYDKQQLSDCCAAMQWGATAAAAAAVPMHQSPIAVAQLGHCGAAVSSQQPHFSTLFGCGTKRQQTPRQRGRQHHTQTDDVIARPPQWCGVVAALSAAAWWLCTAPRCVSDELAQYAHARWCSWCRAHNTFAHDECLFVAAAAAQTSVTCGVYVRM